MSKMLSIAVVATMMTSFAGILLGPKSLTLSTREMPAPAKAQDQAMASEVKIDNFSFTPVNLTVTVGTTVTWTNRDDIPHTVVSTDDPKAFKSKVLDTDERFSFTFSKPGSYAYFCSVHPKMTGKVTVQ